MVCTWGRRDGSEALAGRRGAPPVIHPDDALLDPGPRVPLIAACDHYAGTERRMVKALGLQDERAGAAGPDFDVTLDLEDGAPADAGLDHADLIVDLLRGDLNAHRRAGVRIHGHDHPDWREELRRVVTGAGDVVAHLTIPKARDLADVDAVLDVLSAARADAGCEREIPLHVLVETHGALRDAAAIAARPGVRGLDFGHMDFISCHQGAIPEWAMRSPGQFEHAILRAAKATIASAALCHGAVPAHNVTLAVNDPAQAGRDARRARDEFGFLRMWSIHPSQIEPIVQAFAPDEHQITRAAEILLAASAVDWAPIRHDDELADRASYRHHWLLLQRARALARAIPDDARAAFFAGR